MTAYDIEIDKHIVALLSNGETLSYREMYRLVKQLLGRELSFETYEYHINNMLSKENNQLEKSKTGWRRGKRIYYRLTPFVKRQISLGLFEIIPPSAKKKFAEADYMKNSASQLLLFLCAKKPLFYNSKSYRAGIVGISFEDILHAYRTGYPFGHLEFPTETVGSSIKYLKRRKVIVKLLEHDAIRYDLASTDIAEFVRACWDIYELVRLKLVLTWRWFRRPSREERTWYELREGYYTATKHLIRNTQLRIDFKNNLSDTERKKTTKKVKYLIKLYDENIANLTEKVKTKYSNIIHKFRTLSYLFKLVSPPCTAKKKIGLV